MTVAVSGRFDASRPLGILLLVAGLVGLAAAFALAVEKFRLLENPLYVPPCTLGGAVDCGSVIRSAQAEAFGFPNPFLGIAGFAALAATGLILTTGGRLTRPYWLVLQAGLTLAVVFVHWLMFQTLYRIGALCPYCMVVWAVTIPAFWYVTLYNAQALARHPGRAGRLSAMAIRNHAIILTLWLLLVAALVAERFWAPWDSVFV
ncbi:MAG: vitamin K epoxide reductase family protein [Solirubrobacteraceae bacterium]|nr:vitamin K epoxide reductase family protein [Solirubrobacteraceae bacterium]